MKTDDFIIRANVKHKNKYNYDEINSSEVYYDKKINITCYKHGVFKQTPTAHLSGSGCLKCHIDRVKYNKEIFISKAKKVHGDKYDYTKIKYKGAREKITVTCEKHKHTFSIRATNFLSGIGCYYCGKEKTTNSKLKPYSYFLNLATKQHGKRYSYNENSYTGIESKVEITCKIHGKFKQKASRHIRGQGCPRCLKFIGEERVAKVLENKNVKFICEYRVPGSLYRYDFYLPDLNILIEYDGIQHYKPVGRFGGKEGLKLTQENDEIKNFIADVLRIRLIRISYLDKDNIADILDKKIFKRFPYFIKGKYFKSFFAMAKYFNLPDEANINNYKKYIK